MAKPSPVPVERVVAVMEASRKTLRWELPVGENGEAELGTFRSAGCVRQADADAIFLGSSR